MKFSKIAMLSKIERIQLYLCLFILAFLFSLYFPQNPFVSKYMPLDSSIYQYIGKLITEGYIPYRDVFDHKGPLVYLYYAFGYSMHPMYGVWSFEVILLFFSLVFAYQIVKKYLSPCLYIMSAATILATMPLIDSIGNNECLCFLPMMYAIFIVQKFIKQQKISHLEAMILGALSAMILLIKFTLLVLNCIVVLYIMTIFIRNKRNRELLAFLLYGGGGFLLPVIITLGWLGYHHALQDFFDTYIVFNFKYAQNYKYLQTYSASFLFFAQEWLCLFSVLTGILIFIKFKYFDNEQKTIAALLSAALFLNLVLAVVPRNPHPHYLTVVIPVVLILFSYVIYIYKLPKLSLFLMSLFLLWRVPNIYLTLQNYYQKHESERQIIDNIGQFIQKNYPEDTTILEAYLNHCIFYLYSNRNCPHKYPLSFFASEVEHDKIVQAVRQYPAKLVIDNIYGQYRYFYEPNDYHFLYKEGEVLLLEHN